MLSAVGRRRLLAVRVLPRLVAIPAALAIPAGRTRLLHLLLAVQARALGALVVAALSVRALLAALLLLHVSLLHLALKLAVGGDEPVALVVARDAVGGALDVQAKRRRAELERLRLGQAEAHEAHLADLALVALARVRVVEALVLAGLARDAVHGVERGVGLRVEGGVLLGDARAVADGELLAQLTHVVRRLRAARLVGLLAVGVALHDRVAKAEHRVPVGRGEALGRVEEGDGRGAHEVVSESSRRRSRRHEYLWAQGREGAVSLLEWRERQLG